LAICALVSHVRKNLYNERYLCFTHVFLGLAAGLALYGIAVWLFRFPKAPAAASVTLSIALIGLLLANLPERTPDPEFESLKQLANTVSVRSKQRVLLGHYSEVYRLAALAPAGTLIPLELDFEEDPRTPFNQSALRRGAEVILTHGDPRIDSSGSPLMELVQHKMRLRLVEAHAWTSAGLTLSRYETLGPGK
jgi:hypothetical protein